MTSRRSFLGLLVVTTMAALMGYVVGNAAPGGIANASDAVARATKAQPNRDAYFPNSEDLAPDEMRIIACGTGIPSARESQAAS